MTAPVHRKADVWLVLTVTHADVASPRQTSTYRYSMQPFADAESYRGFSQARVALNGFGTITRAMSTMDGQFNVDTWDIRLLDMDGALRALLADSDTNTVDSGGWEIRGELASEEGRAAEVEPRTIFQGIVDAATPEQGRMFRLNAKDLLGSHLKGFDLDAPLPIPTLSRDFGDLDEFPDANKDVLPNIVYGENSDYGAVDATGADISKGLIPVVYVGKTLISAGLPGTAPTSPVYAHPPSNLTVTPVGGGDTHTVRCGVTAVTTFGETTLSNIVTVTDYPTLTYSDDRTIPHSSAPRRADWSWDPPDNVEGEEVIGYRMYVIDDTTTGTPRYRLDMNFNAAGNAQTTFSDDGDDSHFKSMYPGPPGVNTAQVAPGTPGSPGSGPMFADTFIAAIGVIPFDDNNFGFYGSNLAASGTAKRVLLDASIANSGIRNAQIIAPGDSLWPHADNWIERNGQRYSGFYTRGPIGQAHIDGQVAMALSGPGYSEFADGTGRMLDYAGRVAQHLLTNWAGLDPDHPIYTNGSSWRGIPEFTNGDPKLKTTAFETFQTDGADRMDTIVGPLAAFVINQPMTLREFLTAFSWSFNAFWVTNHHGQLYPIYLPHEADFSDATLFRDRIEVKHWLTPQIDRDVVTEVTFVCDFDAEAQDWRGTETTLSDDDVLAANGGRKKTRERIEMRLVRDFETANTAAIYWLELLKRNRRYQPFDVGYKGHASDIGDLCRLTHYDGIGETGEVETPGIVTGHAFSASEETVTLTMLDVSELQAPIPTRFWGTLASPSRVWGDLASPLRTWGSLS